MRGTLASYRTTEHESPSAFVCMAAAVVIAATALSLQFGSSSALLVLLILVLAPLALRFPAVAVTMLLAADFFPRPLLALPWSPNTYLRIDDICWVLLVLSWLNARKRRLQPRPRLWLARPLAANALLIVSSLIVVLARDYGQDSLAIGYALWEILRWLQYASVYVFVSGLELDVEFRTTFVAIGIMLTILVSVIGLMQYWEVLPLVAPSVAGEELYSYRTVLSTFTSGFHMSMTVMVFALVGLSYYVNMPSRKTSPLALIGFIIAVPMLVVSEVRSAWVGLAVGVAIIAFTRRTGGPNWLAVAASLISLIGLLAGIDALDYFGRSFMWDGGLLPSDLSSQAREVGWSYAVDYAVSRPLILIFGIGFMMWRYVLANVSGITTGHNNYLGVLIELGIPGLIAFAYLWLGCLRESLMRIRQSDNWAIVYLPIIGALLVRSITEDALYPVPGLEGFLGMLFMVTAVFLPPTITLAKISRRE